MSLCEIAKNISHSLRPTDLIARHARAVCHHAPGRIRNAALVSARSEASTARKLSCPVYASCTDENRHRRKHDERVCLQPKTGRRCISASRESRLPARRHGRAGGGEPGRSGSLVAEVSVVPREKRRTHDPVQSEPATSRALESAQPRWLRNPFRRRVLCHYLTGARTRDPCGRQDYRQRHRSARERTENRRTRA